MVRNCLYLPWYINNTPVPNMTPYTQPDNLQGSFAYPENGDYSNTQQNTTLPNVDYGQNQYYSHSVDTSTAYGQMNGNLILRIKYDSI